MIVYIVLLCFNAEFVMCCFRIVERGYYSERDAAHVIKQILEAVAVRPNESWDIKCAFHSHRDVLFMFERQ